MLLHFVIGQKCLVCARLWSNFGFLFLNPMLVYDTLRNTPLRPPVVSVVLSSRCLPRGPHGLLQEIAPFRYFLHIFAKFIAARDIIWGWARELIFEFVRDDTFSHRQSWCPGPFAGISIQLMLYRNYSLVFVSRYGRAFLNNIIDVGLLLGCALPVVVALRPLKFSRTLVPFDSYRDTLSLWTHLPLDHLTDRYRIIQYLLEIAASSLCCLWSPSICKAVYGRLCIQR